jgi:hypothetical protein
MASFVLKAPPQPQAAPSFSFDEKTMWRGKAIRPGDQVFLFAAEHHGGCGLYARGVVTEAVRGSGSRVRLSVTLTAIATRPLGRTELRPYRAQPDLALGRLDPSGMDAEAELDHKLYRQATNKIAGVSDAAAAFLEGFF